MYEITHMSVVQPYVRLLSPRWHARMGTTICGTSYGHYMVTWCAWMYIWEASTQYIMYDQARWARKFAGPFAHRRVSEKWKLLFLVHRKMETWMNFIGFSTIHSHNSAITVRSPNCDPRSPEASVFEDSWSRLGRFN